MTCTQVSLTNVDILLSDHHVQVSCIITVVYMVEPTINRRVKGGSSNERCEDMAVLLFTKNKTIGHEKVEVVTAKV